MAQMKKVSDEKSNQIAELQIEIHKLRLSKQGPAEATRLREQMLGHRIEALAGEMRDEREAEMLRRIVKESGLLQARKEKVKEQPIIYV